MSSPEFQLCIECCRQTFAGDDPGAVHALLPTVDWELFTRVARFHRVQGLVWTGLTTAKAEIPVETAAAFNADAIEIAAANLRIALESQKLLSQFETAGIDVLFVKGLTVGTLAYGSPMLKMGWDIDLLIEAGNLAETADLLAARGYRQVIPPPTMDVQAWHGLYKESVWSRGDLHVELHTRLADSVALIPTIDLQSPRREVEVEPGVFLPTLAMDELFAYLCVHGASSLWFRLKWITDLAAILHRVPIGEVERLYARSQELGAGRASGLALLLADTLYGTLGISPLAAELARDPGTSWLLRISLRQMAGRDDPVEPTSCFGGTLAIHYSQFRLLPGVRFKISELRRQARAALHHRL